jgi:hypothetical protein
MIPRGWKKFCDEYVTGRGYWYVPKGLTVKKDNFGLIKTRLGVLEKYEGKIWSETQNKYVSDLIKRKLFDRRVEGQTDTDKAAIGRMFKVVVSTLGLAWVDRHDKVAITEAGKLALKYKDPKVFFDQINRFQFYNPGFDHREGFVDFQILPVQFICELLNELDDKYITKDEYVLFVSRKKTHDDVHRTALEIEKFRELREQKKRSLIDNLKTVPLKAGGTRRTSLYNTIMLNSPYALQFLGSSDLLEYDGGVLRQEVTDSKIRRFIKKSRKNNSWVDFKSKKDWFYYYGNPGFDSSIRFAVDYYTDISDIENSLAAYDKAVEAGIKVTDYPKKEFKSVLVDEKILEDFLEKHLDSLEAGLKLVKDGRQYSTLVGPIDLLAKDSKGNYVVIELKKGRAADRVIGQVLRYVGFVGANVVKKDKVRAIIVGKKIDDKLKYATKAANIDCRLYEFDYKVSFSQIATQ